LQGFSSSSIAVFLSVLNKLLLSTYFPKAHFMNILGSLVRAWKEDRGKLLDLANELHSHLNANATRWEVVYY